MFNLNSIGVITKVYTSKIVIEIFDTSRLSHNYLGDLYVCEGINTFITIYKSYDDKFIYQIIGLYEIEKPFENEKEESKFFSKAYFEAVPVGEIYNHEFHYGLSKYPMIGNDVYLTSVDDLDAILQVGKEQLTFTLGTLTTHDSYIPRFSINDMLTHHMSILGNTGSGKSTTVRKLLQEIIEVTQKDEFNPNNANFIIFDVHDEYASIPSEYCFSIDVATELAIPLESLTVEDWINLVQPSESAQLPVLLNGLRLANLLDNNTQEISEWVKVFFAMELYRNVQTDVLGKRTKIITLLQDTNDDRIKNCLEKYDSKYGSLGKDEEKNFLEALKQFIKQKSGVEYEACRGLISILMEKADCSTTSLHNLELGIEMNFLFEESKGNTQIRSYCNTLMIRIQNLIATYSSTLFDTHTDKRKKWDETLNFTKGFTIFKVSGIDDNDLLFFTGHVLRTIYHKQKEVRQSNSQVTQLFHFVFDEAHKYIIENNQESLLSIKVFEQIAKEGRKFGIFMILASQRPGELSKTVLSQCNNFILHRIRSNVDLEQMRRSIPYLNDAQLNRLSYLQTGTALFVGEAFAIPMEITIDGEKYGHVSKTPTPSEVWKSEQMEQATNENA